MQKYVDTAVDDLDGFVAIYNLKSLLNILSSLKGKSFEGKNATKAFLEYYREDEGGDNFISDVENVGVKTLGVKGSWYKKEVVKAVYENLKYIGGDNNEQSGLSGINIVWDDKGGSKPGGTTPGGTSGYKGCDDNPLPHPMYCYSSKISDVQKCAGNLKIDGYFGPNTNKRLKELGYDTKDGLTQEIYDSVMRRCNGGEEQSTNPEAQGDMQQIEPRSAEGSIGGLEPIAANIATDEAVKQLSDRLYRAVVDNGTLKTSPNQRKIAYKGKDLNETQLKALDYKLSKMQFVRTKTKNKAYGEKYVWLKQKNK